MKEATYRCANCHHMENRYVERGKITEPEKCPSCGATYSFELMHNHCMFGDKQHVKMQETPDAIPEGETPHTVHLCAYEDLVDHCKPGDRVELVGIYRAHGMPARPGQRVLKTIYRTYIDVIGYTMTDAKRYENEDVAVQ